MMIMLARRYLASAPSQSLLRSLSGLGRDVAGADTSSEKTNPFHDAVERGDVDDVRRFLQEGTSDAVVYMVNSGDPQRANTTPLHLASRRGHIDLVQLLIAHEAHVDARGAWNLTPLMYAAVFDQPAVASLLLESGADASLVDAKGKTALDHAISEKKSAVVAVLRQHSSSSTTTTTT